MPTFKNIASDIGQCITFYTRMPISNSAELTDFARAQWAAPLVGGLVGIVGAAVFTVANLSGLSVALAAIFTLSATILLTGALHEDGLADVADGFGGGHSTERKLEIMKDSRIGTYGVLALIVIFSIKGFALVQLADPVHVTGALIAAHSASRALMPAFMRSLGPARNSGLAKAVGIVPGRSILVALFIGIAGLLAASPIVALVSVPLFALWFVGLRFLARAQIKGHTGDVLGTLEQGGEAIVLVAASVLMV